MKNSSPSPSAEKPVDSWSGFIYAAGVILAVSYPVLALSTGVRAFFQLFLKEGVTNYLGPSMTLVAAACYLTAGLTIVFRESWQQKGWWLSMMVLVFETTMTFIIGTLSFIYPDQIGSTAWRHFGADYGFFPLFQPILGIAWLLHPKTLEAYGVQFLKK